MNHLFYYYGIVYLIYWLYNLFKKQNWDDVDITISESINHVFTIDFIFGILNLIWLIIGLISHEKLLFAVILFLLFISLTTVYSRIRQQYVFYINTVIKIGIVSLILFKHFF